MTAGEAAAPANARIETLTFDDDARVANVALRGDAGARQVAAGSITSLLGARIRHESVTTIADAGGISYGKIALTAATGIPLGVTKGGAKQKTVVGKDLHHAVGLRVADVPEIWYFLADSFNFRKALGPEATYSSDLNLRLFIKRLADFAPDAGRDAYVAAMLARSELPQPLDSLLEFFRSAPR